MVYTTTDNNYGTAKLIVGTTGKANYLTIASALTAASSGDTIFILPGTYTENLTLKAGVNLTAFGCDSSLNGTGNVIISGTSTMTTSGSVTISGIQLQTNSASFLAVTGSAASIVNLENCYLNCTNSTGITYSSSSASSTINCYKCVGNLGTTGIAYYTMTSTGGLLFDYCVLNNIGVSVTASSNSAGAVFFSWCLLTGVVSTTSTGVLSITNTAFNIGAISNTTPITTSGTGSSAIIQGQVTSGSASAVSIGSGTTMLMDMVYISSSNTNAITGAGTCNFSGIFYNPGTSYVNNTTTQTGGTIQGIRAGNAPSVGFIGEQISSVIGSGSSVLLATGVVSNVTSISLTAGIWNVVGIVNFNGIITGTAFLGSIVTTSATLGTQGDNLVESPYPPTANANVCMVIPDYRITLSTTTTIYLTADAVFTVGTCRAYGRISATRVG